MKRLRFRLYTNDTLIIDEEVNYMISRKKISFVIKDELYKYDIEKNILDKDNNESSIIVDFNRKKIKVRLKDLNHSFFMDIEDVRVENNNNCYELEYTFINDEKNTNCIFIDIIKDNC